MAKQMVLADTETGELEGTVRENLLDTIGNANDILVAALTPPPPGDNPTVTLLARADSTLATSGVLRREARYTAADGFASMDPADVRFRFDGTPEMRRVFSDQANYVQSLIVPGGDAQAAYHIPSIETVTDPTNKELELRLRSASAFMLCRVFVDGRPTTPNALNFTGLAAGQPYNLRLAFTTAKSRTIKVVFGDSTGFGGMYVPTGEDLHRPTSARGLRVAVIGDSYEGGSSFPPNGGTRLDTAGYLTALMLGAGSIWNFGIGGTGHVATSSNFQTRAGAVAAISPDIAIVSGSINDGTADTPALRAAVAATLAALATVPDVYVTGPSLNSAYEGNNTAVREATAAAGRTYLDPLNPAWLSASMIGTDNVHPKWTGHQRRAQRIYGGISSARSLGYIDRLTVTTPVVPPPTTGVVVRDTFTRADNTSLGSTETGGLAWTESDAAGFSIVSNTLASVGGTAAASRATVDTGLTQNGQIVRAVFKSAGTVAGALLAHVGPTAETGYLLNRASNGVYTLRRFLSGGSASTLVTLSTPTGAADDVCEIVFRTDSTVLIRVNGVESATVSDTHSRNGRHGVYRYPSHAAVFDSFEVELV